MTEALTNLTSARVAPPMAGPALDEERSSISAFLAGASLEVSSRDPAEIDACVELLEPGTALYISFPPGQTYHGTAALAARVARCGFRPVPHFAARRIADRDALDDYLARSVGEAGVDRVLVIGGDNERPSGAFEPDRAEAPGRRARCRPGICSPPAGSTSTCGRSLCRQRGWKP